MIRSLLAVDWGRAEPKKFGRFPHLRVGTGRSIIMEREPNAGTSEW